MRFARILIAAVFALATMAATQLVHAQSLAQNQAPGQNQSAGEAAPRQIVLTEQHLKGYIASAKDVQELLSLRAKLAEFDDLVQPAFQVDRGIQQPRRADVDAWRGRETEVLDLAHVLG